VAETLAEIVEALVLAGGLGERLRPLTLETPKILVDVGGAPILDHQVAWLRKHGVERVVISCGHLSERIEEYVRSRNLGVDVQLSVESKKLGTGGALNLALGKLHSDVFYVLNGDIITNVDLMGLAWQHRKMGKVATITVVPFTSPYGVVKASDGLLDEFREKPRLPYWINAGVYVMSRRIQPRLPEEGSLEADVLSNMSGEVAVYASEETWIPIDTIKDLREAEVYLSKTRRAL
jgi:mannose-1-phosphate guanylyltransferase